MPLSSPVKYASILLMSLSLVSLSLLAVSTSAPTQEIPAKEANYPGPPGIRSLTHTNDNIRHLLEEVVADTNESVVRFVVGKKQTSLGFIVDARGYIITKSSLLSEDTLCLLSDNNKIDFDIVSVSGEHDLALVKIDQEGLTPLAISEEDLTERGRWVISAGIQDQPMSSGVVSVGPRAIGAPRKPRNMVPLLGFSIKQKDGQVFIQNIYPHTPSANSTLLTGDVISQINTTPVASREQIQSVLEEFEVGDEITLTVQREEELEEQTITLTEMLPFGYDIIKRGLSGRRSGFPMALQHDCLLQPNQCGGPLLAIDGRVIGINIARFNRIGSYAIPASDIGALLDQWLPE